MELFLKRTASIVLPLCRGSNLVLSQGQQYTRKLLPLHTLEAARLSIKENMPDSRIPTPSSLLLLNEARQIQKALKPVPMEKVSHIRRATMDRHTAQRNWRVGVGGISPVKKTGGVSLNEGDLQAQDKLQVKVFRRLRWRWKTVLSEKELASKYGYKAPKQMLSLNTGERSEFTLPLALQWNFTRKSSGRDPGQSTGKTFIAVSAGSLFYHRESHPDEQANVFNPFWKTQLIPIALEPTAGKIVPKIILKEIRH